MCAGARYYGGMKRGDIYSEENVGALGALAIFVILVWLFSLCMAIN